MPPNPSKLADATARLAGPPRWRRARRGQTLVEYALIIAVIAIVAIGVLVAMGQQTKSLFSAITSQVSRASG